MSRWLVVLLSIALLFSMAGPLMAAPAGGRLYVIDYIQVGVRQSQAANSAILETIRTGAHVTRLADSADGQWIKVRTQAGTEGWVLNRYLMENAPAAALISDLPEDQAGLLENLRQENQQLQEKLGANQTSASEWQSKYERLYADSLETVNLRKSHDELKAQLEQQTSRLQELETENQSLNFTSNLSWFMAGGSVLLVGWLLGWLFGKRKRSSSWSSKLRY